MTWRAGRGPNIFQSVINLLELWLVIFFCVYFRKWPSWWPWAWSPQNTWKVSSKLSYSVFNTDQHVSGLKLWLVCTEIQQKRQERKRRSTANPAYSGLFEPEVGPSPHLLPETISLSLCFIKRVVLTLTSVSSLQRKRLPSYYLNSSLFLSAQGRTSVFLILKEVSLV